MIRPTSLFLPLAALVIAIPCAASSKGELVNMTGGPIWLSTVDTVKAKVRLKGDSRWTELKESKKSRIENRDRIEFEAAAKKGPDGILILDSEDRDVGLVHKGTYGLRTWQLTNSDRFQVEVKSGTITVKKAE